MNEGANIVKGRNNNQLVLDKNGGIMVNSAQSKILVNIEPKNPLLSQTPAIVTSNFIVVNPTGSTTNITGAIDIIPLYYPTESIKLPPTGTILDTSSLLLPDTEETFVILFEEGTIFTQTDTIGETDPLINPLATTSGGNINKNGTSSNCSENNYARVISSRRNPYILSYINALSNLEKEILKVDSSKQYKNNIKLLAASIAIAEGWNLQQSIQHITKNPGNLIGTGDAGSYLINGMTYRQYSSYGKGWIAQIEEIIIPYIEGRAAGLTYPGATININWKKDEDNAFYKKVGIEYKDLPSYSYKGGPPTFRQFFNAYAPKCDKDDPILYAANIVKTFEKYFGKKINVDEPIKNII